MSWLPSPEYADWWYDLSWKGIIGFGALAAFATAATVVFTVIQFWSDGVRDQRAEERSNAMEVQLAASAVEIARTNEAAAKANTETERLRSQMAWRRISDAQANKIADALRTAGLRPRVVVNSNDPEAANFGEDVKAVLRLAGDPDPDWFQNLTPETFRGLAATGPSETDRQVLAHAFEAGGFEVVDGGDAQRLEIVIGLKPSPF